jgi:cytochrome c oxidase accessory protein FixG
MTPEPTSSKPKAADRDSAAQAVDWSNFRDHLSTADQQGRRQWMYPRRVSGHFYRWRTRFSWLLLCLMLAGPFITLNGNPLLLLNVVERKFVVLGQIFWPQDMIIFAIALLLGAVSIVVFTTAFGRLWCGWACPQTVMMEMVFRKIEYAIEGDAPAQRALNRAPWTARKLLQKALKHGLFFALSFLVGNVLLSYLIGWRELRRIITDPPAEHLAGLLLMAGFSLLFYGIFARFREQACTFICPYGRLQALLVDENTILVAYDHRRGEKRGPFRQGQNSADRRRAGLGDCVACNRCVAVCPTGIDIRNGVQMECVQCTACIDACDSVMDKIRAPRGLIRYASLNGLERHEALRFTPRLAGYAIVLAVLAAVLAALVFLRSDVQATVLRTPGSLFQQLPDGRFSNLYTVRLVNKTSRELPVELRLENLPGTLSVMGAGNLLVPPQKLSQDSVLIELDPSVMKSGNTPLVLGVYSGGRRLQTLKTAFIGPRN